MNLSQNTIDAVKASTPLIGKNAEAITTRMYEILFTQLSHIDSSKNTN